MPCSPDEDSSDLLARLRAQEDEAYIRFVRKWAPRFERDLRKHGFVPADAYDLSFSCATHVLTKLESYERGSDGFDGWILTVGRNFARDWRRKNSRLVFVALRDTVASPDIPASEEPEHGRLPFAPALIALSEALAMLSVADRKLVELHYLNGSETFGEIAKALSIKSSAARTRHHRILKRLKDLLESDPRIRGVVPQAETNS